MTGSDMRKANIYADGELREVKPFWFTGKTWMKDVSSMIGVDRQDIYHVHFEQGARTKLHQHSGSQVLIATAGSGSLEVFRRLGAGSKSFCIEKIGLVRLEPGDVVYIPAGELHTHGSTDDTTEFAHIAINNLPSAGGRYTTDWYESDFKSKVTSII